MRGLHPEEITMRSRGSRVVSESVVGPDQERAAEALVAAIRQPLHDLTAAAEEAEKGRLGGAKLGVLVAAGGIVKVLQAIDAEFERQRCADATAQRGRTDCSEEASSPPR
jgi:hypothetical protein